jgi:hypothetical protein
VRLHKKGVNERLHVGQQRRRGSKSRKLYTRRPPLSFIQAASACLTQSKATSKEKYPPPPPPPEFHTTVAVNKKWMDYAPLPRIQTPSHAVENGSCGSVCAPTLQSALANGRVSVRCACNNRDPSTDRVFLSTAPSVQTSVGWHTDLWCLEACASSPSRSPSLSLSLGSSLCTRLLASEKITRISFGCERNATANSFRAMTSLLSSLTPTIPRKALTT